VKSRVIAGAALVLIAVVALAVACGGDGSGDGRGDEAGIRTRQGRGVAALAAGAEAGDSQGTAMGGEDAAGAPVPGAPSDVVSGGKGAGFVAPDFYPYPTLQESQKGITGQGLR